MATDTVPVTGWGRTAPTTARLIRPRDYAEAVAAVRDCGPRGGIARGLGRAYGDSAQNAGGHVFDMTGLDRVHVVDADDGTVLCDAGVSLHRLMQVLLPLGWFVPVVPGTRRVTVGGALAGDVHGSDHPVAGTFSRHVLSFELLTADGSVHTVPHGTPLFDATAGGLGLTGVILTVTLRLLPVETALMCVGTERARDLDEVMARLANAARRHRHATARIDLLARGAATGRGIVTHADHAPAAALRPGTRAWQEPPSFRPRRLPAPPAFVPAGLLGRTTAALAGELRHRRAARTRTELRPISTSFHPLDGVPHWNRLYGRRGLVHYQCLLGYGEEDTLRRIVRRLAEHRCPSFPAVLKRFGETGPGWLSFPAPGWSLALDLPAHLPGLAALLDALDEEVAAAGGRVCLAKDARLRPDLLTAMYPRLADFRRLRAELDPGGVFTSDLARRLGL
ncbi:FAD-binding oxidoreductase [Streptomyces sp. NPDC028635]|uniref:FAD-dependent oxidoreductase n=1 Tax=Streptomyces sp. NPDC028635 TaxID=3154800 RepID=UPI00340F1F88